MILTIVTLMVTHDHGALPVGSHSSPELYKVGAMTVSSPQMKTVRLRDKVPPGQINQAKLVLKYLMLKGSSHLKLQYWQSGSEVGPDYPVKSKRSGEIISLPVAPK